MFNCIAQFRVGIPRVPRTTRIFAIHGDEAPAQMRLTSLTGLAPASMAGGARQIQVSGENCGSKWAHHGIHGTFLHQCH